jgi:hypothetical protein
MDVQLVKRLVDGGLGSKHWSGRHRFTDDRLNKCWRFSAYHVRCAMSDETEAVAQLQAMGFEWSDAWSHWQRIHNGAAIVSTRRCRDGGQPA